MVDSGQADLVLAGGVESYSRRPLRLRTDPDGGPAVPYEQAPFTPWPDRDPEMAVAAATLAEAEGYSRAAQEAWAIESHAKALARTDWPEIVPLMGQGRDAFARPLTPALAARARPIAGTVTPATAAVSADAAAFCLIAADRFARPGALNLAGGLTRGGVPDQPGTAPIAAIRAVLGRAGLSPADLTQSEIMEAYAAQAIACVAGAGLDPATVNPGGGALSRGHPIGASGAILAVRLFHDLPAGGWGLAAIASAGGIGTAALLRRL